MKVIKKCLCSVALTGLALSVPLTAGAAMTLTLSDVTTTVTVTDQGPGDANTTVGVITYVGAVGSNWTANVTTGLSKPVLGAPQLMDLNSVNSSQGAGGLFVALTDTDFDLGTFDGLLEATIGGTIPEVVGALNSITYDALADASNAEFGGGVLWGGSFSSPPVSFSDSGSAPFSATGPFSATLVTLLTHSGQGTSYFDFALNLAVPEPATLALFGLGLAGLGAVRRKKLAA